MSKTVPIVCAAILGLGAIVFFSTKALNKGSTANNAETFIRLSCGEILTELERNEANFIRKYKGKAVQITGTVKKVESQFGPLSINMPSGIEGNYSACIAFPHKKSEWPYALNKGDELTVKCEAVQISLSSVNLLKCNQS